MERRLVSTGRWVAFVLGLACVSPSLAGHPAVFDWTRYGREHGLAANKVLAVEAADGEIWAGTPAGLYHRPRAGKFAKVPLGALDSSGILSLKLDRVTKELWVGTFEGLARVSRGRVDVYTQLNSGLVNNVVYSVCVQGPYVWQATAAGVSRMDTRTGRWAIFNERNSPMKEIWCYGVSWAGDHVYVAVWGGGVMEYKLSTGIWKNYFDPDGEFEIDLFRDDGPTSNITSNIDYDGKHVWVSTYFGIARYDGRRWKEYYQTTGEGLPSDFVNMTRSGPTRVWVCTDRGLAAFDGRIFTHEVPDVQAHSVAFDGETTVAGTDNGVFVGKMAPSGAAPAGGRK